MELNNPDSYKTGRPDVVRHINKATRVLDVGCNEGAVSRLVKAHHKDAKFWGMEWNEEALSKAEGLYEQSWQIDLNRVDEVKQKLDNLTFDAIIGADVFEHLQNPLPLVNYLYSRLENGGTIYISLPHTGHWHVFLHIMRLKWPRNPEGVFDKTHLRIFLRRNLEEFAEVCPNSSFRLLDRRMKFLDIINGNIFVKGMNRVVKIFKPIPYIREFFTFQYIFSIKKP